MGKTYRRRLTGPKSFHRANRGSLLGERYGLGWGGKRWKNKLAPTPRTFLGLVGERGGDKRLAYNLATLRRSARASGRRPRRRRGTKRRGGRTRCRGGRTRRRGGRTRRRGTRRRGTRRRGTRRRGRR